MPIKEQPPRESAGLSAGAGSGLGADAGKRASARAESLLFAALTAVCVLAFCPLAQNANLIKEYLWTSGLVLLAGGILAARGRERARQGAGDMLRIWKAGRGFWICLGLWAAWALIRAAGAYDPLGAREKILRLAVYGATFAAAGTLLARRRALRGWIEALAWSGAVSSAYLLAQALGWDFIAWAARDRPPGTFANPNFSALALAAIFPAALSADWRSGPHGRAGKSQGRPSGLHRGAGGSHRRVFGFLRRFPFRSALIVLGIFATQSRAGLAALAAGAALAWIFFAFQRARTSAPNSQKIPQSGSRGISQAGLREIAQADPRGTSQLGPRRILRFALLAILGLEIAAAALVWFMPERLNHLASTSTIQVRRMLWKGAWELWLQRPWAGWGLGAYSLISQRVLYLLDPIHGARQAGHAHNWLLEMMVEQGIVGAGLFLAAIGLAARAVWGAFLAARHEWDKRTIAGTACGAAALLFGALGEVWLDWWEGGWMLSILAGACMAAIAAASAAAGSSPTAPELELEERKWPAGRGAIFRLAGAGILLAGGMLAFYYIREFKREMLELRGNQLAAASHYEMAAEILAANANAPRASTTARIARALSLAQLNRAPEAIRELETAIRREPRDAPLLMTLGQAQAAAGCLADAAKSLERAHELQPSGLMAAEWARILHESGQSARAAGILKDQLARAIYPPALHLFLEIEDAAGKTREARDTLAQLRRQPLGLVSKERRAELARWEADLSVLLGEFVPAKMAYEDALILSPRAYQVWNDYGIALKRLRLWKRADQAFARAEELAPKKGFSTLNRIELRIQTGELDQARSLLGASSEFVRR